MVWAIQKPLRPNPPKAEFFLKSIFKKIKIFNEIWQNQLFSLHIFERNNVWLRARELRNTSVDSCFNV